jgi:hypothetical protein
MGAQPRAPFMAERLAKAIGWKANSRATMRAIRVRSGPLVERRLRYCERILRAVFIQGKEADVIRQVARRSERHHTLLKPISPIGCLCFLRKSLNASSAIS